MITTETARERGWEREERRGVGGEGVGREGKNDVKRSQRWCKTIVTCWLRCNQQGLIENDKKKVTIKLN